MHPGSGGEGVTAARVRAGVDPFHGRADRVSRGRCWQLLAWCPVLVAQVTQLGVSISAHGKPPVPLLLLSRTRS